MARYSDLLTRKGTGTSFDTCRPVAGEELEHLGACVSPLPTEYTDFLAQIGFGTLGLDSFALYSGPVEPVEVYGPDTTLPGVLLVGDDLAGVCAAVVRGTGRVVEIDPVTHDQRDVAENFESFIRAKIAELTR